MSLKNVRINPDTHAKLKKLASELGRSTSEVLATAIDALYRQRFLEDCNRAYTRLKTSPKGWRRKIADRRGWDATLADGFKSNSVLPPLPKPDKHGNFPAIEYARISLARDIIRDRRTAGLKQQELANSVGARQETISRIETGKHTASLKLVEKIDRVLQRALKKSGKRKGAENRR